jgi:hypothetical protein
MEELFVFVSMEREKLSAGQWTRGFQKLPYLEKSTMTSSKLDLEAWPRVFSCSLALARLPGSLAWYLERNKMLELGWDALLV